MLGANCSTCQCHDTYVRFGRQPTRFTPEFSAQIEAGLHPPLFATSSDHTHLNSQCLITQLPAEILHSILDKAIAENFPRGISDLALVCKAFHLYMEERYFTHISLARPNFSYNDEEHSLAPACSRVNNLYSLLVADPGLGQLCTSLSIKLPLLKTIDGVDESLDSDDYALASNLLSLLPNIRNLEVHNGFGQQLTVPFLKKALHGRKHLESVKFACDWLKRKSKGESYLALADVWGCIQTLQLDKLCVYGVRPKKDQSIWKFPEELANTFSVASIELANYGDTPETLETFLRLLPPNTLRHFSFSISIEVQKSKVWSLQVLQRLLTDQCDSIKRMSIGTLTASHSPGTFQDLSFQDFQVLETLSLSRWDMGPKVCPQIASKAILAPKLQKFEWDFSDPLREKWSAFTAMQRDWLLEFAQCAIDRRAKLNTIKIIFTPTLSWDSQDQVKLFEKSWPWDLMDEVKEGVKPNIDVIYNDHVSKKECESLAASFARLVYGARHVS